MSLDDAYTKIKRGQSIVNLSAGGRFPEIEKDITIKNLTQDVFQQMAELDKKDNPNPPPVVPDNSQLKTFSFEDAIKELHSMMKKDK
jgi:hypothetical protein